MITRKPNHSNGLCGDKFYNFLDNKKYSPKDLLLYFSQVKKIKIQDQWKVAEVPQKVEALIKKYDIPIP